jgi:hypothetical protein
MTTTFQSDWSLKWVQEITKRFGFGLLVYSFLLVGPKENIWLKKETGKKDDK